MRGPRSWKRDYLRPKLHPGKIYVNCSRLQRLPFKQARPRPESGFLLYWQEDTRRRPYHVARRSCMGIQDLFEGFRRWLDGEEAVVASADGQPKPRSKWEDFMVAIAREVEAVMQREMFTPPGGPTYIPREYVVFMSPDDDAEWQGEKREGLE